MNTEELMRRITAKVMDKLKEFNRFKVPIGVSNRHVHVTKEDLETLYGPGYELTCKKELGQPGQFAANETVTLRGPKGEFKKVRILGPLRDKSQVEISKTDGFRLGVKSPVRESGHLDGTPGIELVGPKGVVKMDSGTIVALRHIHMTPQQAQSVGVKNGDVVDVETFGERAGVLGNVVIRVSPKFDLEMHIDLYEANACSLSNKDYVVIKPQEN